jgi:RND family efflux transporter MFP subunit
VQAALVLTLVTVIALPACRRAAPRETEAEPAIPVIAEPVRLGTIRAKISATGVVGTLPGAAFAVVASQPARIADVTKNVGDAVKSGEMLVRFEFPSLGAQTAVNESAVKAADLRVKQAQLTQGRIQMLVDKGAASRAELDDSARELAVAEGELAAAKAALSLVQAQGGNTTIRAPFDGTVTERLHNPGDNVRADENDPILRLIDPKQVQVMATLPVADTARFVIGATARATAEGPPSREAALRRGFAQQELLRVATRPAPESGAKTVDVTLAFDTPTDLRPGTQVGIEIDAEQRSNVPLVPAVAVIRDNPAQPIVVVAAGGVVQRRPVVIGLVDGENIEILSGLKPGELIITQGHSTLRDGSLISVSAP